MPTDERSEITLEKYLEARRNHPAYLGLRLLDQVIDDGTNELDLV